MGERFRAGDLANNLPCGLYFANVYRAGRHTAAMIAYPTPDERDGAPNRDGLLATIEFRVDLFIPIPQTRTRKDQRPRFAHPDEITVGSRWCGWVYPWDTRAFEMVMVPPKCMPDWSDHELLGYADLQILSRASMMAAAG